MAYPTIRPQAGLRAGQCMGLSETVVMEVIGLYLDISLQRLKLCVKARLAGALRNPLFQLLQLLLLSHLVSDLYVFALLIEAERPSTPLFRSPFEAFIIRGRCRPRRVWIDGIRGYWCDCGHRWWGGGISGVSLATLIRFSNHEQRTVY